MAEKRATFDLAARQLQFVGPEKMLEGPELSASWQEVSLRGRLAGDSFQPGQVVFLEPHSTKLAANLWKAGAVEAEEQAKEAREQLSFAREQQADCLILVPVHSEQPQHWTALVLSRETGETFQAVRHDSLSPGSANAALAAQTVFDFVRACIGPEKFSQSVLPAATTLVTQTDGWSCGFHTVSRLEEAYRQFRGEGWKRVYTQPNQARVSLNRWLANVLQAVQPKAPLGPPPAPPPETDPPEPLPLPGQEQAAAPSGLWGCSRCRFSKAGCLSCCPEKQLKAALDKQ
ncbi:MAG: hypothetical protein GY772_16670 [bacterium]|nr:hypothetical protein [bacterium]